MADYQEVEPLMRGQWREFILAKCGVDTEQKKSGVGHECPVCGGNDRAHFKEKDGRVFLFCRGACGNANSTWGKNTCTTPEHLCQTLNGWDFNELVNECAEWVGYIDSSRENGHRRRSQSKPTPKPEPLVTEESKPTESRTTSLTPINQILPLCKKLNWLEIPFCAQNALSGKDGEFLTLNGNLFVPVGITFSGSRFSIVGGIEYSVDGVRKWGNTSGACAYFGDGEKTVFATDVVAALNLAKQYRVIFSIDVRVAQKEQVDYVFLNADLKTPEIIDKAISTFGSGVAYLTPSYGRGGSYMRKYDKFTADELSGLANQMERAHETESTHEIEIKSERSEQVDNYSNKATGESQ